MGANLEEKARQHPGAEEGKRGQGREAEGGDMDDHTLDDTGEFGGGDQPGTGILHRGRPRERVGRDVEVASGEGIGRYPRGELTGYCILRMR